MQTADYNHSDFSQTAEADKSLLVKFYYVERPDTAETAAQGRPVFKEVAYIDVRIPGQRHPQVVRAATARDLQRFPDHYDAFIKRVEAPAEGMTLTEWPLITRSRVEELAFINIKTVESLADVSDAHIVSIPGGYSLRDKAKKWLISNEKELEEGERAEMQATIKKQGEQIAALLAVAEMKAPAQGAASEPSDIPDVEQTGALTSELDEEVEPIEGAAVPVPAAPAAKAATKRKKRK
jgi:hypothetical protein